MATPSLYIVAMMPLRGVASPTLLWWVLGCGPGLLAQTSEGETSTDPTNGVPGTSGGVPTGESTAAPTATTAGSAATTEDSPTSGDVVTSTGADTGATSGEPATGASITGETAATSSETSSTGGMDTSSSGDDPPPCVEFSEALAFGAPKLVLVLDKSGSMDLAVPGWDHDMDPNTPHISRWNSLRQVVAQVVAAHDAELELGVALFPSLAASNVYDVTACPVQDPLELPAAAMNGANVLALLPPGDTTMLEGGTPAAAGLTAALTHLAGFTARPRAAVLVTDGLANCRLAVNSEKERFEVYDEAVHAVVVDAYAEQGIVTHVVGIEPFDMVTPEVQDGNPDGVNQVDKLDLLANQGGRPRGGPGDKFHRADNQLELQAAFDAIVADTQRCVLALPSEPLFVDKVDVVIDGGLVPKIQDCGAEHGWTYVFPLGPFIEIELCGSACADLKAVGEAEVQHFCTD